MCHVFYPVIFIKESRVAELYKYLSSSFGLVSTAYCTLASEIENTSISAPNNYLWRGLNEDLSRNQKLMISEASDSFGAEL